MKKFIVIGMLLLAVKTKAQIGIGTTSPNSTLDVSGSLATKIRIFTTTYTADITDCNLIFTGTSATTITLPDATTITGRMYVIKNASTNTSALTIATTSSQTIDGITSQALTSAYQTLTVVSNGTGWNIMAYGLPAGSGTNWSQGGNAVIGITTLGTTTNYSLPFITNNIERMRMNTSGNLGINTTSQTEKLQVEGNIRLSGSGRSIFFDGVSDPYAGIKNVSRTGEVNELMLFSGNDVSGLYGADRIRLATHEIHLATSSTNAGVNSGDPTSFYESTTNAPTRLLIDQNGSVGINVASSATFNSTNPEKLYINSGTATNTALYATGDVNDFLQLNIQNSNNGNFASSDIVATANNGTSGTVYIDMGINSQGYSTGSSTILNGTNTAYLFATGTDFYIGNGAQNKDLIFFTNTGATGPDGTERMRITSTKMTVRNDLFPEYNNSFSLGSTTLKWKEVYATNGTIQTSDRRLKTNIQELKYGLKEVLALNPVRYNWKTTPSADNKIGLIAQDVRKIIPEVVVGDEAKENIGMNYAELVPVLINAIKEQQQQIDELKKEMKSLKTKH